MNYTYISHWHLSTSIHFGVKASVGRKTTKKRAKQIPQSIETPANNQHANQRGAVGACRQQPPSTQGFDLRPRVPIYCRFIYNIKYII